MIIYNRNKISYPQIYVNIIVIANCQNEDIVKTMLSSLSY